MALAAPTAAEARCGRRCAAKSSVGGAVGCQGGLARCCEEGSAWRGAAERAKIQGGQRVGSGARLQYARSGRAPGVHGTCSTLCQSTLEVAVEAGN